MQVKLKVLQGSQAGKEIGISVESFVIGRDAACQLRARSDLISRRHCEIAIENGEVVARDMGSRNGTYVNGERIEGNCQLNVGDHLRVGRLEFEIRIDHTLSGKKRPKVKSVKEAATRTVEDRGQGDEISSWLEEADEIERVGRQIDPETRQFKLDETDRVTLEAASASEESDDVKEEDTDVESKKKKEPGKLPKRQSADSIDSSSAATDMLKKMFNRR
jgi:pSer/pThr/pTyr-binding forkhead associated (FHA) protein